MSNPSQPPFWETRRGGGPVTDWLESRRKIAEKYANRYRIGETPPVGMSSTDGNRRTPASMPRKQVGE